MAINRSKIINRTTDLTVDTLNMLITRDSEYGFETIEPRSHLILDSVIKLSSSVKFLVAVQFNESSLQREFRLVFLFNSVVALQKRHYSFI
jgi:hypothetical protein